MEDKLLSLIEGIGIVGALMYFLWWKRTLHSEIVKPDVDGINSRIDFLESRVEKTEELYDRIQDNLEQKIDKLQETIIALTKEVAQISGQLKAMQNDYKG